MSDIVKYGTATFVKDVHGMRGKVKMFRLDPPLSGYGGIEASLALVSAVEVLGEPETYIFACNEDGKVTEWMELPGSYRGGLSHERALRNAGYDTIVYNQP